MPTALPLLVAALLSAAPASPETPQPVQPMRRTGQQPAAWYAEQARLWAQQVERAPQDPAAWYSLYLATEYAARDQDGGETAAGPALDQILARMAAAVPESWQLPVLRLRRLGPAPQDERRRLVASARARGPSCPEVREEAALAAEGDGDRGAAARLWTALYQAGDTAP
ncbi:MAG: hypothetical protein ABIL09_28035, partial [Gemmatimonadota bacterium]